MRASKRPRLIGPTLRPKPRHTPRMPHSMSSSLAWMSLRAVSSERTSWALPDLACTGPVPAEPQQLGYAARIAAVGLHHHRRQGCLYMPRLQEHRLQAGGAQSCVDPLRQRTCFKRDARDRLLQRSKIANQVVGIARHLGLTDNATLRIEDAHAR